MSEVCIGYWKMNEIDHHFSELEVPGKNRGFPGDNSVFESQSSFISQNRAVQKRFPFLYYAITSWMGHFSASQRPNQVRADFLQKNFSWPSSERNAILWNTIYCKFFNCPWRLSKRFNTSVLHIAARYGMVNQVIQIRKTKGGDAKYMNARDFRGRTALFEAAACGHVSVAREVLVDAKSIITMLETADDCGLVPLSIAAANGHVEVVRYLLGLYRDRNRQLANLRASKRPFYDVQDKRQRTPLAWAAALGHTQIVQILLDERANPNTEDETKHTPLSLAAMSGHENIVQLLLARGGVHLDHRDDYGMTPLSLACLYGYDTVIKILIQRGADLNAVDKQGITPVIFTAMEGRHTLALDPRSELEPLWRDRTDLLEPKIRALPSDYANILELLLSKGAEVNAIHRGGETALGIATANNNQHLIRILLRHGADPNIEH